MVELGRSSEVNGTSNGLSCTICMKNLEKHSIEDLVECMLALPKK
jgi:hypothetical protein